MSIEANAPEIALNTVDNPNPSPETVNLTPPAPEVAPEAETPPPAPSARDQIAARFRAQREAEPETPSLDYTAMPFVQPQEAAPQPVIEDTPGPAPAPEPAPETYRLKVRGNEFVMSREDILKTAGLSEEEAVGIPMPSLLRAAQINAAAQDYLAEAKHTHKDARTAARDPGAPPARESADAEPDQPRARVTPDQDVLELAEKIQFGDREEAAAALERLVETKLERQRAAEFEKQFKDQTVKAVQEFQNANPDLFVSDQPMRADLLYVAAARQIREDLIRVGFPRDQVEQNVVNPEIAAKALEEARKAGHAVRHPNDILNAAAQDVRKLLNLSAQPTPSAPAGAPSRTDLKRALTPQPNTATVPPAVNVPPPAPRSGSSVILGMRKARGQAV